MDKGFKIIIRGEIGGLPFEDIYTFDKKESRDTVFDLMRELMKSETEYIDMYVSLYHRDAIKAVGRQ